MTEASLQVVLVEDEPTAARRLRRLLQEVHPAAQVLTILDRVDSAVSWFGSNPAPDLIFMDIELIDGTAFEIFEQIQIEAPVIFCTAFDRDAVRAFKVNSIDYLLKPVEAADLRAGLEKLRRLRSPPPIPWADLERMIRRAEEGRGIEKGHKTRFLVGSPRELRSVPVSEVALFFTRDKIVRLMTLEGRTHLIDHSLDELEGMLSSTEFFRANRQTLLALPAIDCVRTELGRLYVKLTLPRAPEILVSRERSKTFRRWLGD